MQNFEDLGLDQDLLAAVKDLGFEKPSSIQSEAIPFLLEKDWDLIALSQTGTGKTAAFGFPIIQKIETDSKHPSAIIIAPTRELCLQISKELLIYSKYKRNISVVAVYGGANISEQIRKIRKGVNIVVATPGRIKDIIDRREINLGSIKYCVLDEADEMLNMGFYEDIRHILSVTSSEKNIWLFSATMPRQVLKIAQDFMHDPHEITVGNKNTGNLDISHEYYILNRDQKYNSTKKILSINKDFFGVMFCRTKAETQSVALELSNDGYKVGAIHGDLSQAQRDIVMDSFRKKQIKMLIATDVASRGIDVNDITHVINYQLPDDIEVYTHRSGRTGRAGKKGISISFVNRGELGRIKAIERMIKQNFDEKSLPTDDDIFKQILNDYLSKIENDPPKEEVLEYLTDIDLNKFDSIGISCSELVKRVLSVTFSKDIAKIKEQRLNQLDSKNRSSSKNGRLSSGMARFFINLGEKDDFDWASLKDMIRDVSNLEKEQVTGVDVKDTFSFFNVDEYNKELIFNCFKNYKHGKRKVSVELSNNEEGRRSRGNNRRNNSGGFRRQRTGTRNSRSYVRDI